MVDHSRQGLFVKIVAIHDQCEGEGEAADRTYRKHVIKENSINL